jgi:hypothetical protein
MRQCHTQTNVVGLYSFVLYLPENGTPMPKHVGVSIIVMNCISLSAFVGGCIDYKNARFDYKIHTRCEMFYANPRNLKI